MKLYYSPGACSLASHIALVEMGEPYEKVRVDLKTHKTETGEDFYAINPKGYVPTIVDDEFGMISENPAVLICLADRGGVLQSGQGFYDLLQWIGFTGTQIHGGFRPLFGGDDDAHQQKAKDGLAKSFGLAADLMQGNDWLVGDRPSVADNYLFVTTRWADKFGIEVPPAIAAFRQRNLDRRSVKTAMAEEGIA